MGPTPPVRVSFGEAFSPSESRASRSAQQQVSRLAELRQVHEAFAWFRSHARELEELQLQVTSIPAPPWGEAVRGQWLAERFTELRLADVHRDELGNVLGDVRVPHLAQRRGIDEVQITRHQFRKGILRTFLHIASEQLAVIHHLFT